MSISTYKNFSNKVVKEDAKSIQIESKANAGSDSSYSKIVTWISNPDYRLEKVEYYDKSGKLLKRAEFKGYAKVAGKFWRAKQMVVSNLQEKRTTSLIMLKVSVKEIDDDEVSLAALEE